jgi:hypothetical protein
MTTNDPTRFQPMVIALPIDDRRRSYRFYAEGLGLQAVGELAEDGIPEPLQLQLNDGVRAHAPPREGFGWVVGGRPWGYTGTFADPDGHLWTVLAEGGAW